MEHWLAALILSLSVIIIAVLFNKRIDRLLRIVEFVNKAPSEQDADNVAPTDEEFKKQVHDFMDDDIDKKKEPADEIVIESLEEGRRVKVKPTEKKADFV